MSKFKFSVDLPSISAIVADLTPPREPPGAQAVVDAEAALDRLRRRDRAAERQVAELPQRIKRGEVKATALSEALRDRQEAGMLVTAAADALAAARTMAHSANTAARLALDLEIGRRIEILQRAADEVAPVLEHLVELAAALAKARGPGTFIPLDWPDSPSTSVRQRMTLLGGVG